MCIFPRPWVLGYVAPQTEHQFSRNSQLQSQVVGLWIQVRLSIEAALMCEESQLCQYSGSHRVEGLENGDYKAGYFRGAKGVCPAPVIDFPPSP